MPIYECDYLFDIIQARPLTSASLRFIKASQCNNKVTSDNTPIVCCSQAIDDNNESSERNPDHNYFGGGTKQFNYPNFSRRKLLVPYTAPIIKTRSNLLNEECGRETIGNRIYSGDDTEIHDFPWMGVLEYRKRKLFTCQ